MAVTRKSVFTIFAVVLLLFVACIGLVALDIYGYNSYLAKNGVSAREAASGNLYGSSGALCLPMKDYQRNRILAFVAPNFPVLVLARVLQAFAAGITLPLISYGGSSILSYFIVFGMIMNISSHAKKYSDFTYN